MAGVAGELVAMGRRVAGECGGRPGHPGLVDEERVSSGSGDQSRANVWWKPATLPVHCPRIPVAGQFLTKEGVHPATERGEILPGYGVPAPPRSNQEKRE